MGCAAERGKAKCGTDAKEFVLRKLYVDDGITSVDLLRRMQRMLAEANLRLHKLASNSSTVMEAFPPEERAKELKDLDLSADTLPLQRSLGISWDLTTDCFTFRVSRDVKPFTRRRTLSTVNSLYDPWGLCLPSLCRERHLSGTSPLCSKTGMSHFLQKRGLSGKHGLTDL
jgi:hypothetical protein